MKAYRVCLFEKLLGMVEVESPGEIRFYPAVHLICLSHEEIDHISDRMEDLRREALLRG